MHKRHIVFNVQIQQIFTFLTLLQDGVVIFLSSQPRKGKSRARVLMNQLPLNNYFKKKKINFASIFLLFRSPTTRRRETKKRRNHTRAKSNLTHSLSIASPRHTTTEMRRCKTDKFFSVEPMRFLAFLLICSFSLAFSADSVIGTDSVITREEINGTSAESNATNAKPKEDSFADMIDRALEKEFPENDQNDGSSTRSSVFAFRLSSAFAAELA